MVADGLLDQLRLGQPMRRQQLVHAAAVMLGCNREPDRKSLKILRQFRDNGHIDPDLYDVFMEKKIYMKYAQRFLDPEQIDGYIDAPIATPAIG